MNVGIIDPIVLPGLGNCFKVSFQFVNAQGQELGDGAVVDYRDGLWLATIT